MNGRLPASFDGTDDKLGSPLPLSMLLSASAWSCVLLVYVDIASAAGNAGELEMIGDTGSKWSIGTFVNAGPKAVVGQFDGALKYVETPVALAAWNLIQAKFDGTNLALRVNGGVWVTAPSGNIQVTTGTVNVGRNYTGAVFFKGRMLELLTSAMALPDPTFNDIKGYMNLRYGLAL